MVYGMHPFHQCIPAHCPHLGRQQTDPLWEWMLMYSSLPPLLNLTQIYNDDHYTIATLHKANADNMQLSANTSSVCNLWLCTLSPMNTLKNTLSWTCLSLELDVDEVGLRPVRLPVGVLLAVPQQVHPAAWLGAGDAPHRLLPDLAQAAVLRQAVLDCRWPNLFSRVRFVPGRGEGKGEGGRPRGTPSGLRSPKIFSRIVNLCVCERRGRGGGVCDDCGLWGARDVSYDLILSL